MNRSDSRARQANSQDTTAAPANSSSAGSAAAALAAATAPPRRSRPTQVDYPIVPLRDLRVVTSEDPKLKRETAVGVEVAGERFAVTGRFWRSLFQRFGLAGNLFRYFRYDEVFARVVAANPDERLRLCAERFAGGTTRPPRLLAVSSPRRPILGYDDATAILGRYHAGRSAAGGPDTGGIVGVVGGGAVGGPAGGVGGAGPTYHDGVVTSAHVPRSGEYGFDIGPDRFHNRFVVECPIDGFGQPRIFLSLLRQVCSNGAIGYARAFRSDVRVGADAARTLERALGQFDHDEGFAALRQRFESAQRSWASVHEVMTLRRALARSGTRETPTHDLQNRLDRVAGDLNALYGLANLESLSAKRQRVLPAKCRVYDLVNFASEVATHRAAADAQVRLQAYIGSLVSDEYDLEGTAERVPEFADLFLNVN